MDHFRLPFQQNSQDPLVDHYSMDYQNPQGNQSPPVHSQFSVHPLAMINMHNQPVSHFAYTSGSMQMIAPHSFSRPFHAQSATTIGYPSSPLDYPVENSPWPGTNSDVSTPIEEYNFSLQPATFTSDPRQQTTVPFYPSTVHYPSINPTSKFRARFKGLRMSEADAELTIVPAGPHAPIVFRRRTSGGSSSGRKQLPKVHSCAHCEKKFDRPSTLKVHEAIHSGTKDHSCEYCSRAFTVLSNMKRHMRVCKHKPLSLPLALCYYPHDPPDTQLSLKVPSSISPSSSFVLPPFVPRIFSQTANDGPPSILVLDISIAVKAWKTPMAIAEMFSIEQHVPTSICQLDLAQGECDVPLKPIRPHEKYAAIYVIKAGIDLADFTPLKGFYEMGVHRQFARMEEIEGPRQDSETVLFTPSRDYAPPHGESSQDSSASHEGTSSSSTSSENPLEASFIAKQLLSLPSDLLEERNSYYPRTRFCYHPAEYDPIMTLPGPGLVDIPDQGSYSALRSEDVIRV